MNRNTVNHNNFNLTMEGYVLYALMDEQLDDETRKKVMRGLSWAKDMMTMEDARSYAKKYYNQKYCGGGIDNE